MTPLPSISESATLFAGLPKTVKPPVINLLLWLRLSADADGFSRIGHDALARAMHVSPRNLSRIFTAGQEYIHVVHRYKIGDRVTHTNVYPNQPHHPGGKYLGMWSELNWRAIKEISDGSIAILSMLTESETEEQLGVTRWLSGGEGIGKGENLGTDISCAAAPNDVTPTRAALSADDANALFNRLDEIVHEVQRRKGKDIENIVHGEPDNWKLRKFVAIQESVGIWAPWERVANWFSFWVQYHATKNLKFAYRAFISQGPQFKAKLEEWESANPETRWREFPPEPPRPNLDDPNVKAVADSVHALTKVPATKPLKAAIWAVLQHHATDQVISAVEFRYRSDEPVPHASRDVKSDVLGFFEGDHVEAALSEKRAKDEEAARIATAKQESERQALMSARYLATARAAAQQKRAYEAKYDGWRYSWDRRCESITISDQELMDWWANNPMEESEEYPQRVTDMIRDGRQRHLEKLTAAEKQLPAAIAFLREFLRDGKYRDYEVLSLAAKDANLDAVVLQRAFVALGCQTGTVRIGDGSRMTSWRLPQAVPAFTCS